MRKFIITLTASAVMAAGAVAGLQNAAPANAARSGGADHAVTQFASASRVNRVRFPGGGCGGCRIA